MTRIDIAEVQQFAHSLKASNQEAKKYIQQTQVAIQDFVSDRSITGQAVSSAQVYFSAAYFSLCQSIVQALNVSGNALQQYIIDFHSQVDASPNAKLDMDNLMVLEDKIAQYENKRDQLLAEMSDVSSAIHGALNGSGQSDSLLIRGLTADITEAHKKERILEKYIDFERSHVGFSDELNDLAVAIQRAVDDIRQNLVFNDKNGIFDVRNLHVDRFKKLQDLYAKQKEIDDKVKELESIGLTPYIPSGNTAGFVLNPDGTLNTEATLEQVNTQVVYWQNETGMREFFGVGSFYRAIYGTDYVSGEDVSKGARVFEGLTVLAMYSAPYGMTMGIGSKSAVKSIDPFKIRYSQSSVNGSEELVASMKLNGWQGAPIDVVIMPNGYYATLDNTRVVAARDAGIKVQANIKKYNDILPEEMIDRFTTKQGVPSTWGEAIDLRINKQNAPFRKSYPQGSFKMEDKK
ncbi:hypothetical protein HCB44_02355 [Listeria sp. FSL L7-0229]|uniref:T7SS effector LXG polymorphic toxin n=1 Tax=Listeria cossartiae TaxID=2838249 RepID=UPI0016271250|nr:T7SS effector LXG polymorphic toxin [Listeria cossartiae]MBC2191123.1 hypothetical protein [Listeria cossartiae subsp. cossartiae]